MVSARAAALAAIALALTTAVFAQGMAVSPSVAFGAPLEVAGHSASVEGAGSAWADGSLHSQAVAKPSKKQLKAFKKASADFAIDLFKRSVTTKGKNANVTIAPMSVLNALAMTANGASGKTAKQLYGVLADGASAKRFDKNLRWYNGQLANSRKAKLSSANAIWYHGSGSLAIKKKFVDVNRIYLGAAVKPADFANPQTVVDINSWVSENTGGMIKKVVDRLDPDSRVVLANALYFDAEWKHPYMSDDVRKSTFTTAAGKKSRVKMMYSSESRYISGKVAGKGVRGFVKPYAKGYSYVALLPEKGLSLKKFVSALDGDTFRKLIAGAKGKLVRAGLPKHSVSYANQNMKKELKSMGIKLAFDPMRANFSAMGKDSSGRLFVDAVIHKTRVDVDERGTKAAAVTAVMVKANTAIFPQPKTVILNRPFVYAIIDNATKLPVFIGTVNNI